MHSEMNVDAIEMQPITVSNKPQKPDTVTIAIPPYASQLSSAPRNERRHTRVISPARSGTDRLRISTVHVMDSDSSD
jgi:hypothetical protein